jgi:RHS repeat-associated protein
VWLDDLPIATLRPTGTGSPTPVDIFYVHSDHLGTPRAITRPSDSSFVWRWDNTDPFGANAPNENPTSQGTFKYNLRFPGQYYDTETGIDYNYFRDYDPSIGRYVESDPIGLRGGINTYGYANGDPLAYVDPTGESWTIGGAIAGLGIAYGAYKVWDRYDKLSVCTKQCAAQCGNIVACGDKERTGMFLDNQERCKKTCVPLCVAEFTGGPKKGPTGPQPPKTTPDYIK